MNAQTAYNTFQKISKQVNEIKVLYTHLKNDYKLMSDKEVKIRSRKIINKLSAIDIDEMKDCVDSLKKYVGERKIVIAREISKIYEEVISGTPSEVEKYFLDNKDKIRGEFVVLVSEK